LKVLVIGAGVVGVTSAWYLAKAGHQVTVLDRQPAAGLETSFANGGQISVSHAEPWANPHAPLRASGLDAARGRAIAVPPALGCGLLDWSLRFLRECSTRRTRDNMRQIVNLALYSRRQLQALRAETSLAYDHLERGILHVYTDRASSPRPSRPPVLMREFGCERRTVSVDECIAIEPALAPASALLVGGDYTAADESGDAHRFTQQLAAAARRAASFFTTACHGRAADRRAGRVAGVLVGR
jgi:D-amino-acid dehydrogenase